MFKIGLKLWSTNKNYVAEAARLFDAGVYQYIELFAVPGSLKDTLSFWKDVKIPFIIHAPHFMTGLNFADESKFDSNMKLASEAFKYADALCADKIIFHPGANGDINETIRQINFLNDSRIFVENKPCLGIDHKTICVGCTPEEIELILSECGVKFCFDFGHAVYAANYFKKEKLKFISDFFALNSELFHITDGDWNGVFDEHLHLGQGSFEFKKIMKYYPSDAQVSIESRHDCADNLNDFKQDVNFLIDLNIQ